MNKLGRKPIKLNKKQKKILKKFVDVYKQWKLMKNQKRVLIRLSKETDKKLKELKIQVLSMTNLVKRNKIPAPQIAKLLGLTRQYTWFLINKGRKLKSKLKK